MAQSAQASFSLSSHDVRAGFIPRPTSPRAHRNDMHFNPRGYRLWADAQLAFLLDPRTPSARKGSARRKNGRAGPAVMRIRTPQLTGLLVGVAVPAGYLVPEFLDRARWAAASE